jgi:hypothetical protein
MEQQLCKDCINFIYEDEKVSCDIGYFQDVDIYKALLYIPELFDCED